MTTAYRPHDIIPTLQTMAILEYMRWRHKKRMGYGINDRHLKIAAMRIGLYGFERHTFSAIASEHGFSQTRASQIYNMIRKNIDINCKRKKVNPVEMNIIQGRGF